MKFSVGAIIYLATLSDVFAQTGTKSTKSDGKSTKTAKSSKVTSAPVNPSPVPPTPTPPAPTPVTSSPSASPFSFEEPGEPTVAPSLGTASPVTSSPSASPVTAPPSASPSVSPTSSPTASPVTPSPSASPVTAPPSASPSVSPTSPTASPSVSPSKSPVKPDPGAIADYFVLTYTFTDGVDLDTRTGLLKPTSTPWVGYGSAEDTIGNPPFLEWGGDNQGLGHEAALINIPIFKLNYPGVEELTLDLRAQWTTFVGFDPVVIQATSYVGGVMVKDEFSWINPYATNTFNGFSNVTKVITKNGISDLCGPGERIATMTINFVKGVITYGN